MVVYMGYIYNSTTLKNKYNFMKKQKIIDILKQKLSEAITDLNQKDKDGQEVYSEYRAQLDYNNTAQSNTITELIQNADIDSIDFSIGFEQGYLRGLETALSVTIQK
jgi:hypothetical protein